MTRAACSTSRSSTTGSLYALMKISVIILNIDIIVRSHALTAEHSSIVKVLLPKYK